MKVGKLIAMDNPLKTLRLQLKYSPERLAREARIQVAAIGQAEEGFYPNPLPSLMLALRVIPGSGEERIIINQYHQYQLEKRKSNGPHGNPKLTLSPSFSTDVHPLKAWRRQSGLATYGFCSAFCIHMPSVNMFEKNIMKLTENPPKAIAKPLLQAGYDLDEFIEASKLYKAALLTRIRLLNDLPLVSVASVASVVSVA
jgi:DNA-binding XRE family transcriptional regulator